MESFMRRMPSGSRPVSGSSKKMTRGELEQAAGDDQLLLHAAGKFDRERVHFVRQFQLAE
jgi:hypothetical protein